VAGLATSFGSGAMTNSVAEIGEASCILAIGTNTTTAHPVIGVEVKRALRGGGKLIVANPREISLCRMADIWLQHRPGSDVALLMGMMWIIVDEGLLDLSFIQERCENFEAFLDSLKEFHPKFAEQVTGVPAEQLAQAARMFATSKPATILYTMGITQHTHGTDNVMAVANLAMLTGNIGKPSTGVNPLRGQNNVQGACDMGSLPTVYPGYQSVADAKVQQKFQEAWGAKLSPTPGRTLTEIIEAPNLEPMKAIYLVGENPVLSDPDAAHVRKALERLEFLVVQDIFLTETAQLADVVLPAASFAEKDGTFTNTERRVQRVRKVVDSPGESRPDWWITCQIARLMGAKGFDYQSPEEIMAEIARLTPADRAAVALSYSRAPGDRLPAQGHLLQREGEVRTAAVPASSRAARRRLSPHPDHGEKPLSLPYQHHDQEGEGTEKAPQSGAAGDQSRRRSEAGHHRRPDGQGLLPPRSGDRHRQGDHCLSTRSGLYDLPFRRNSHQCAHQPGPRPGSQNPGTENSRRKSGSP